MAPMIIARHTNNPRPTNAKIESNALSDQVLSPSKDHPLAGDYHHNISKWRQMTPDVGSSEKGQPVPVPDKVQGPSPDRRPVSALLPPQVSVQPNSVCKVIKGEIHNVLNTMRADARYVSPLRFMEELPSDEHHPLLFQLRDLHTALSEWEALQTKPPDPKMYLAPFCAAIKGRDISASVTGAALQAIHKFLLYGFVTAEDSPAALTNIANTLLLCTFEESSDSTPSQSATTVGGDSASGTSMLKNHGTQGRLAANLAGNAANGSRGDDEQVVLKLLDLSALITRCACHTLDPQLVVGLLDTCLHVSHRAKRASSLLKSAAADASGRIVLHVFSQPLQVRKEGQPQITPTASNTNNANTSTTKPATSPRVAILARLASLLDLKQSSDSYVKNSLMLVNIALETLQGDPSPEEIAILQSDLCKFLLQLSTTNDLVILSLTLRVIFNLFQSIRNHIKVPLEVFLSSVHLRILENSRSPEEREVALESLLEFCREPALMKDLYLNYDCDVNCTNLYESICTTLGNVAAPSSFCNVSSNQVTVELDKTLEPPLNGPPNGTIAAKAAQAAAEVPLNALNLLALEGLMSIIDSISRRCRKSPVRPPTNQNSRDDVSQGVEEESSTVSGQVTEAELQERKKKKLAMTKTANEFNKDPNSKEWIEIGRELGVFKVKPASVAKFLYSAPGLDKKVLGAYLSRGPSEAYPFEHDVRVEFVRQYNFSKDLNFASCLRVFLSKFRMPGEAQCIDRFMEAFSKELYRQQGAGSIFKNSDAIFVLAFSTIMLNTDLHNRMIKNKTRMTCDQFIRNNRGLNDGEDLPEEMLRELYQQIKSTEIQVQREIGEFIMHSDPARPADFRAAWEDLLTKNVETPSFTTADDARRTMYQAGVHEKDMFMVIAKPAIKALSSAFLRSWDDGTLVEVLKGFETMGRVSTFFDMDNTLNEILAFLLANGREYIHGCISLEYAGIDRGAPINQSPDDDETMSIVDPDSPVPVTLLKVREYAVVDTKKMDISGSAAYRGLLALHMGLKIVRSVFHRVRGAWPVLIEVLCALRDARALPAGLADLDDFADSNGDVLPLSPFAQDSQQRLDDYYRGQTDDDSTEKKGWFRLPFFRRGRKGDDIEEQEPEPVPEKQMGPLRGELTANAKTLLQVGERLEVDKFMMADASTMFPIVNETIKRLLQAVQDIQVKDSPTYEQHASFALELAVRSLLANRDYAIELFPSFVKTFEAIVHNTKGEAELSTPFLIERVVVTILRSSIHLYSIPQVRPELRTSLELLKLLPKDRFLRHISDRIACGLAIILRSSFYSFTNSDEWKFIGDSFDVLAAFDDARGLVFDGIASTIEYAVPESTEIDLSAYETMLKDKPTLSLQGCATLQRNLFKFVYGSYDGDTSLAVPAMLCLEKTYRHMVHLILLNEKNDEKRSRYDEDKTVPDMELWYRISVALYSVSCSVDAEQSKHGWECFQRVVLPVDVTEIPDEKWIAMLNLITNKQPPLSADSSRVNTFSVFGQVMIRVLPALTHREKNWKPLTEITKKFAVLAEENLRYGRHGRAKPLFEYTRQTLTYMSSHIATTEFGAETRYSAWASDHLAKVLENVGLGGGASEKSNGPKRGDNTVGRSGVKQNGL